MVVASLFLGEFARQLFVVVDRRAAPIRHRSLAHASSAFCLRVQTAMAEPRPGEPLPKDRRPSASREGVGPRMGPMRCRRCGVVCLVTPILVAAIAERSISLSRSSPVLPPGHRFALVDQSRAGISPTRRAAGACGVHPLLRLLPASGGNGWSMTRRPARRTRSGSRRPSSSSRLSRRSAEPWRGAIARRGSGGVRSR